MDFSLNLGVLDEGKLVKIDENKLYDVTVIGAGPAAVSAAIYSARKGLSVAMVGLKVGGQVLDTDGIENIIGTISTTGAKFAESLHEHLKEHEVAFKEGHLVTEIKEDGKDKIFVTDDGKSYRTKTLIVATGAKPRGLNIPGEKEYTGKGVHYCSTCDGPFYKGLDVAVIGGGNSGVEAAIDLSGIAKSVTLIEFMPEMKADKVLQDKLAERENIKVILNSATKEVIGKEFVESIKYVDRATEKEHDLKVNGMFIEIGLSPRSELVKDLVEINKIGEIEITRFITRIGAELRNDYNSFRDLRRDFNLLELINTKYSSRHELGTLHPKILKLFGKEASKKENLDIYDVNFYVNCLNGNIERDVIIAYINLKLQMENENYSNEELYQYLVKILENLGKDREISQKKRVIPRKITIE